MQRCPELKKTALCALLGSLALPALAQTSPLNFAVMPPGNADRTPAPNVIISIDDSGSMADSGKMTTLKAALKSVFGVNGSAPPFIPDDAIRLAWQVMWNNGNIAGAGTLGPGQINSIKLLDPGHRKDFIDFVDSLTSNRGTPSHSMMRQAYEYMKTTGTNGPWASKSSTGGTEYLACRRAYHIFMTDGRWNLFRNETDDLDVNRDGVQSSADNVDGTARTLPDGMSYNISPQTSVYRDSYDSTLADWAFKSWAEDLQPGIANEVPQSPDYAGAPETETFGGVALQKYWNPRYDPAKWQHLVTYTIGYGPEATEWRTDAIVKPTSVLPFGYDGSFPELVDGSRSWPSMDLDMSKLRLMNFGCNYAVPDTCPDTISFTYPAWSADYDKSNNLLDNEKNRTLDLWHAAINGRGRYYAVANNADLQAAFESILAKIKDENSSSIAGIGASGSANVYDNVGLFTAGYDADKAWSGYVYADSYTPGGSLVRAWGSGGTGPGGHVTTAQKLNAAEFDVDKRVVLTTRDTDGTGVAFRWAANETYLSTEQKAFLGSSDGEREKVLNFLRGDRSNETSATPPGTLRPRQSRQGDIVNSGVWYVGAPASSYTANGYQTFRSSKRARTPMLYVGGNDGMLHGFSASDGSEKMAYVPKGLMDKLKDLADPGYSHKYYVDNMPFSGDVNTGRTTWKTMLIGTLGGGGRGYFVLDVTDASFSDTDAGAKSRVVLDRTSLASEPPDPASDDAYIGHIFAPPVLDDVNPSVTTQITRMNDGRWAVIMGNGYNSVNQKPALLIQYLDGDNELFVSSALVAGDADSYGTSYYAPVGGTPVEYPNGLSAPRVVDLNGDGTADVVYAGDLRGNLWKFDLTSTEPSEWKVAFDGAPLYSAAQTTGNSGQPIFAPPTVKANDVPGVGGVMVAFGTGMNVTVADRNNTNLQTLYSVLDNTRYEKDSAHSGKLKVVTTARGSPGQPGYVPAPTVVGSGTSMLQEQTIGASSTGDGRTFWNLSDNDVDWANEKKGWYLNLTGTSERLLKAMSFYAGTNILAVFTQVPATGASSSDPEVESCTGSVTAEKQYFTLINIVDGKSPSIPLMDRNGDGFYNATDGGVSRTQISGGATKIVYGQKTAKVFSGGVGGAGGGGGNCAAGDPSCVSPRLPPEVPIRPSWRQL